MWNLYSLYETEAEAREHQSEFIFVDTQVKEQHGLFALYVYDDREDYDYPFDSYESNKPEPEWFDKLYGDCPF